MPRTYLAHHELENFLMTIFIMLVQVCQSEEWKPVSIPAGCVAVLPGYTLERATCELIKAMVHRVVCLQCTHPYHALTSCLPSIAAAKQK